MRMRVFYGCLAMALMPSMVLAEDQATNLRAAVQRVAVLATSKEPDLEAALRALSPKAGQDWAMIDGREYLIVGPDTDPTRAAWQTPLGQTSADLAEPVVYADCVQLGAPSLAALLEIYIVETGQPVRVRASGEVPTRLLLALELYLLQAVAKAGDGAQLAGAQMALQCNVDLANDGVLSDADWAALAEGLSPQFKRVTTVAGGAEAKSLGIAEGQLYLTAEEAADPSLRLVSLVARQKVNFVNGEPLTLADGSLQPIGVVTVSFVILRMADGS